MERKKKSKIDGRSMFDVISEKFFFLLKNGIFGRFFTSYDEANEKYLQSSKRRRKMVGHSKFKKSVSKSIQKNVIIKAFLQLAEWLLRVTTRDYGFILITMGATIALLYPLNEYVLFLEVTFHMFVSGLIVCALGIPFLLSGKSISANICKSKLGDLILFKFFGISKERMRQTAEKKRVSFTNVAFFVGIGLGVLSYFTTPLGLVGIILLVILAYCVLRHPEIGALVVITILPFASAKILLYCVLFVLFSYTMKCILGRRTFKIEYFDIFVIMIFVITFIRGAISTNPKESIISASFLACFTLFYFVLTNLIRSKEWFRRCLISLVFSGLAVAVIAIIQVIFGNVDVNIPQLSFLFIDGKNAVGTFNDSNVLAHYLTAVIPFSMVHFISERNGWKKFNGVLIGIIMVVALCLTNSLSGIVGIACATLLLLMIFNRNYVYLTLAILVMCPVLYFTLPKNALESILSTKLLAGVSLSGLIDETMHGLKLILEKPFGIGLGEENFKAIFQTNEGYFDNAIIQALLEYGIIVFIGILVFAVMLIRLTFSYCLKAKNQYRKINCCASFCAVTGLTLAGVANYTWHDKRIFLMFWILIALSFAYIRIEREENAPESLIYDHTMSVLDIVLDEEANQDKTPSRKYVRLPKNSDAKLKKQISDYTSNSREKQQQREEFNNSSEYQIIENTLENPLEIEKAPLKIQIADADSIDAITEDDA